MIGPATSSRLVMGDANPPVLAALAQDMGRLGYQRDLDGDHVVTFIKRGRRLLVVFETLDNPLKVVGRRCTLNLSLFLGHQLFSL